LITSALAAAAPLNTFSIGYADSADGVIPGQPANSVEVRYTRTGDANLDRTVDSNDVIQTARNFLIAGRTAWDQGNFNYDSVVNLADINLVQKNLNTTLTVAAVSSAASGSTASTPDSHASTQPLSASGASDDANVADRWSKKSREHRRNGH
jgi:hypothetical protein